MIIPTPDEIRAAREAAGLTQTEAAELVHRKLRAWQNWEGGFREIDLAAWELFCIKSRAGDPAAISGQGRP